jgi:hypothetical protein
MFAARLRQPDERGTIFFFHLPENRISYSASPLRGAISTMPDEKPQDSNSTPQPADDQIDRRDLAKRAGKFLGYTAPALLALMTAKEAQAT